VPRKVLLNTWEAVYFDHDLPTLLALADAAADIGVERFVLDDGWFRHRRHDRAGLGDWFVDADVWPNGLAPLIDHVRGLGMEFGIWVEPEMVNPDSDLYRAHPDWALVDHRYEPPLARNQLVLDLANPQARTYVYERLHALLSDHQIGYVKWDMNRNHVAATHDGRAGTHVQTLALYGLLDDLRAAHPSVEIESCSSGGGRADAAILERTVRLWTSDCNDALERQAIQRGCSYLFPPEVMGAHIGPTHSHTTGRVHTLAFRATTALFGHLGIEWNVLTLDATERAALRVVVALHQRLRPLLHHGTVHRMDPVGPHAHAHAVVARDQRWAVAALVQLSSAPSPVPPALRIPGLDPDRRYRVERVVLPGEELGSHRRLPGWLLPGAVPLVMSGRELAVVGVPVPVLHPESAAMVEVTAAD
jgi:alpha-galactosidase